MGDSRGHWEGDTLVIETTNFNGKVGITRNGNTLLTSADLKLTERLTRVDADTLIYEATVDDPAHVDAPWKVSLPLTQHPEYRVLRVRVPRRQLRDAEHPERGTGGREGGAREWNDQPALTRGRPSISEDQEESVQVGHHRDTVAGLRDDLAAARNDRRRARLLVQIDRGLEVPDGQLQSSSAGILDASGKRVALDPRHFQKFQCHARAWQGARRAT